MPVSINWYDFTFRDGKRERVSTSGGGLIMSISGSGRVLSIYEIVGSGVIVCGCMLSLYWVISFSSLVARDLLIGESFVLMCWRGVTSCGLSRR